MQRHWSKNMKILVLMCSLFILEIAKTIAQNDCAFCDNASLPLCPPSDLLQNMRFSTCVDVRSCIIILGQEINETDFMCLVNSPEIPKNSNQNILEMFPDESFPKETSTASALDDTIMTDTEGLETNIVISPVLEKEALPLLNETYFYTSESATTEDDYTAMETEISDDWEISTTTENVVYDSSKRKTPQTSPTNFYCYGCFGIDCLAQPKQKIRCRKIRNVRLGCFTSIYRGKPNVTQRDCAFELIEEQIALNSDDNSQIYVCYESGCNNKSMISRATFIYFSHLLHLAPLFIFITNFCTHNQKFA